MDTENPPDSSNFIKKVWITAGIISLTAISLLLFKTLFGILLLVLAGILMAIYFHGCAYWLQKWTHLPPKMAVLASVLINFIILGLFFWFVGARLQEQIAELSDTLPRTIDNAKTWLKQYPAGQKAINYLKDSGDSGKTLATVKTFFSSSFGILSDTYIILLLGLFFTSNPNSYKNGVIKLLPSKAKNTGQKLLHEIHKVLKDWIKGQLLGFLFIAILTAIGLWIIGMPLILTLALVAGLMNFIPNFGPIIALVPALLLALTKDPTTALIIICLYTGIQIVQSAVTDPLIQKKMTNLPPALVIFAQVAMGILGGFWGVLLATPLMAILTTILKNLYTDRQLNSEEF